MDKPRTGVRRRKIIRGVIVGVLLLAAIPAVTIGLSRLKPAAPGVEMSTLWPGTVKRGPMLREVRGLGTLVPEETMLVPATTDARVERILIRPGSSVKVDSVIMTLTSPELDTALLNAEYSLKAAEADYANLKVTLEKTKLDMQAVMAQVGADYNTAKLKADRDAALSKEGLYSEVDAKISGVAAEQLNGRYQLEQKRLTINSEAEEAQLAAQKVKVEQLRAEFNLKKSQVDQLKVRAGVDGMLQQLPAPVEEGQKVMAGTPLAKISQPSKLKAELKIAETQVKDITIGLPATVDTRNGLIEGKVSRIDPAATQGTVRVDVRLEGELPPGARPDLTVEGTIELEHLTNVLYVERPAFGQPHSTVGLFKVEKDGDIAERIPVKLGASSVKTVEIQGGLAEGDKVILSDMSQWDHTDRIRLR